MGVAALELRRLDDDGQTAVSVGVCPTAEVRVIFTSLTRECASKRTSGCDDSDLLDVSIPDTETVIGAGAFENCTSLLRVCIPKSVTQIGSGAFAGCSSLTRVVIPDSVTQIGSSAFEGCECLLQINLPNAVTHIRPNAFAGCASLRSLAFTCEVA